MQNKVNIADNIPRYLQSELKLLTTQCVIIETENLGSKLTGALIILKQYPIHKCGHEKKPLPGSACLLSMLGKNNDKHYIMATQDKDLQANVRKIPGVPLLYLFQRAPVLDPPTHVSISAANAKLNGQFEQEKNVIDNLKVQGGIKIDEHKPFKKKKKKGPNPLSCKKKKKANQPITKQKNTTKNEIDTKRRKKIRIPKHVKEAIVNNKK